MYLLTVNAHSVFIGVDSSEFSN